MSELYKVWGLAGLLLAAAAPVAQAQFAYTPASATNVAGTFTDLGTGGTVITTVNTDDANSAAQNIGFTFNYNGTAFTQFVLNTNGLVRLGASAPSAANVFGQYETGMAVGVEPISSTNPADVNLLMPFNFDLEAGSSAAEYRVATTGTAPNRVCTIQWKNVSDKVGSAAKQYANFTFQVKLYETSSVIEFVYNAPTASTGTAAPRFPTVGIKGSDASQGHDVLANKDASSNPWSNTIFLTGEYGNSTHNFRANVGPDAGRTYRFTPCTPTTIATFPYSENFDGLSEGTLPCAASVLDANGDFYSWAVTDLSGAGDNALVYFYNDNDSSIGGNDWYYTPGLSLRAGYTYQVQFSYAVADASYPEALEVKWGNAATPAAQANTLFSNTNIINETFQTTVAIQVATITPATTGIYYVGFHEISQPDQYALAVDDIQITETRVLGVRNATNGVFTAEASPVPFGESLNLTLNTLKPGPLHLTLRDALGRTLRQSTAAATAGTSTVAVPEVGSLPGGVYFLTVEQGGQSQVLRVSHQ
ncbi:MAG: T9SS type A sorting domain-containing protein [Hymenobacter sp.]|nr:MAG: T9SS type A sorting domain-containing protein [Hymenobacter sp.]